MVELKIKTLGKTSALSSEFRKLLALRMFWAERDCYAGREGTEEIKRSGPLGHMAQVCAFGNSYDCEWQAKPWGLRSWLSSVPPPSKRRRKDPGGGSHFRVAPPRASRSGWTHCQKCRSSGAPARPSQQPRPGQAPGVPEARPEEFFSVHTPASLRCWERNTLLKAVWSWVELEFKCPSFRVPTDGGWGSSRAFCPLSCKPKPFQIVPGPLCLSREPPHSLLSLW